MTRWQTSYQHIQGYSDLHTRSERVYPAPIYEGTHYPATNRGQLEYAVSHSSHSYPYAQSQQHLHEHHYIQPVVTSQVDDSRTHHDPATGSGRSWSGTGSPLRAPAAVTHMSEKRECQKPMQQTSAVCSSAPHCGYAGSFLAEVQKFVVRRSEAFDMLVDGSRGREEEIHHNVHSGDMCKLKHKEWYLLLVLFLSIYSLR